MNPSTNGHSAVHHDLKPRIVIWEMTQACQLACVHCRAHAQPERDPRELSTAEACRVIDEIAGFGNTLFVMTGGDPMERTDLLTLVRYAVRQGLTTAFSPSATEKVTVEKLRDLKRGGLHRVALSLDAPDEAGHDAFRGVAGSYRRTLEIARMLREIGLPLQIGTTVTTANVDRLRELAEQAGALGAILWNVFFLVPTGRAQASLMIRPQRCEEALHQLVEISKRARFAMKTTEAPHYRRVVAEMIQDRPRAQSNINDAKGFVFLSHTGEVFPSGFLPISAGNVRYHSLAEIYQFSSLFRSLRNPDQFKGKCGKCEYRHLCGGSRARAYAVTGDPLESDPLCAYQPAAILDPAASPHA
ncbi:MAG TPA: radical SAM protein [Elusimicrobiota bacterium]|nr:radical SAM protein [Elusimicrobiota bacterium]